MGASDITYSSHSRANGCTCPLHGYQFIAWGCFLYFALFYFMTTVPHILDELQPIAYVILAIFLIVHLIVHLLASCINPADPNVLKKMKQGHRSVGSFNRSEHRHVIENQHCYLCEVDVGVKSKHCSTCNKCVADFDHHCKWLNNCVGGRNYRLFIATLCTAISGTLVIFVTCLVQFVAYYTDKENGELLKPYHDIFVDSMSDGALFMASLLPTTQADVTNPEFQLFYITVPDLAWQIMTMFTTVLAALATGLMGHLLGFHIYLMCKNLSTYDYIIREREKSEQRAREQDVDERSPDMNRSKNRPNKIQPNDDEMQAKHQSRGGIDEYAIVETAQLSGETPPPVHTPPLSVRNHSHHGAIPTLSQQISHEAGHTRRKKKRSKHLSSSVEYPTGLSNTLPLSPGNSIRTPVNGHLPTLDDSQELMERIRHSQDDDQMAEGMSREGPIPSSAVQQIGFSMRRKQKMHSRQEAVFSSAATSGTDDAGCTATDSGCDLENGSLVNLQAKPSKSPDLSSRQCNCEPRLISSVEQTHSSVDSYSSRYSRTNHLQNNVAVERLDLPHSSDSDYDGSNSKEKGHLPVYGQRAFNTDSNVYRTLPAISTHLVNNPRNKPAYNGMGSSESLHEIPVSCTQHGRRHANKHHSGGFHSYGPEIGVPVPRRPKRNRHKDSSKHGIVNHGAKLNENSSTSDEDAEGEGVLMAPHGVCYGNSVTHTVEIYSDRTPRPPRHKDVPPLDLSALHHDSDTDHTKRTNKSNRHEQASKI